VVVAVAWFGITAPTVRRQTDPVPPQQPVAEEAAA
jgi:hypothetical protein